MDSETLDPDSSLTLSEDDAQYYNSFGEALKYGFAINRAFQREQARTGASKETVLKQLTLLPRARIFQPE